MIWGSFIFYFYFLEDFFKKAMIFRSFYWPHSRLCDLKCLAKWTSYICIHTHTHTHTHTYRNTLHLQSTWQRSKRHSQASCVPASQDPPKCTHTSAFCHHWLVYVHDLFSQPLNFLFCIGIEPINNVVVVSGEQQRVIAIKIHVSFLPLKPPPIQAGA